jgi:hypothetical protein
VIEIQMTSETPNDYSILILVPIPLSRMQCVRHTRDAKADSRKRAKVEEKAT